MIFGTTAFYPMVLYHVTRKDRVAKIRRQGLKPHVPGKVWGVCEPALTRHKPVVWLTADKGTWKHDRHPNKAWRDPDGVLLAIMIDWSEPRLKHFMSWIDPRKKKPWSTHKDNPAAWFVYFGMIKPVQIIGGLERERPRRALRGYPARPVAERTGRRLRAHSYSASPAGSTPEENRGEASRRREANSEPRQHRV